MSKTLSTALSILLPTVPIGRVSQPIRRAAYSCTLVCQLATSGTLSFHAKYAPKIPNSLGPVMWMISGRKARTVSEISPE